MAKAKKGSTPETSASIDVLQVETETVRFHLLGTSPLVCNAMSAKTMQNLILPPVKKSRSQREATLKHEPMEEYRRSPYKALGNDAPTRIVFPGGGIKGALANAALDIPGAAKRQIGRLATVLEYNVPIYGIPQIYCTVVRSADMNKTPDVRTRAILPEWACAVDIRFVTPLLRATAVSNLLASAGITIGIGDGRPEKGKLAFGQFRIVPPTDPTYQRILKSGGRAAQDAALKNPTYYDVETEQLLEWFNAEVARRGFKVSA